MTTVRRATAADVPTIAEIHVRTWQVAYADIFPASVLDAQSVGERATMWSRALENDAFDIYVADDDGVRGFVSVGPSDRVPGAGEVWAIYVDPDAWRAGVGTALLDHALERLRERGYTEAVLETVARSPQSRGFYDARGWTPGETRTEVFRGVPEELVLYRRAVS